MVAAAFFSRDVTSSPSPPVLMIYIDIDIDLDKDIIDIDINKDMDHGKVEMQTLCLDNTRQIQPPPHFHPGKPITYSEV